MPNLRIILTEWDVQQLLRGETLTVYGDGRQQEIALDPVNLENIKSTIESTLFKQKPKQERGES